MVTAHIACGNVAWERELLDACARAGVDHVRRHVDAAGLLAAVAEPATVARLVITSPALRGFAERALQGVAALAPTVIVVDGIEPEWLAASELDIRGRADFDAETWIAAAMNASVAPLPAPATAAAPAADVTVYVGVSGGVGVTTLALEHAAAIDDCVVVEGNLRFPALAVAAGLPGDTRGWPEALEQQRPLSALHACGSVRVMPAHTADVDPGPQTFAHLLGLVPAARIVVDAGCLAHDGAVAAIGLADRVVVVADASPLGMVRLCLAAPEIRALQRPFTIVVNRVRASATGSARPGAAMSDIVRETFGVEPVLQEQTAAFDTAWLRARWPARAHPATGGAVVTRAALRAR